MRRRAPGRAMPRSIQFLNKKYGLPALWCRSRLAQGAFCVAEGWWTMSPTIQTLPPASSPARASLAERLQKIVLGWRGAERNQPVTALHDECSTAAGPSAHLLLPERVFFVRDLDRISLRAEMARRRLLRSDSDPR